MSGSIISPYSSKSTQNIIKPISPLRPGCTAGLKDIYFLVSEEWENFLLRMHHLYKNPLMRMCGEL